MLMWLTAVGSLLLLLRALFPYWLDDCAHILRSLLLAVRLLKYKRSKPFHSVLDAFLAAARRHPAKTFLHFEGERFSYGDVDLRSNRLARVLRQEARLREGDAVALFLGNEPNLVCAWLGLAKLGCPVALLNFHIRAKSLLHCFSRCGAKVLVTSAGLPKAAIVTHERMWAASFIQSVCGVTRDDVFYINLPLYHSSGFLIGLGGSIERGISVVLKRKFSASQFWDDCREHNVTVMQYIGETMRYLCNAPEKDNEKEHKVRLALGNGLRRDVWSEFLRRFGDIKVKELYAATEGNIGFINYTSKVGAVGRLNFFHRLIFPYLLIKFDIEKEEPVRNSQGLCIEAARGEMGLLVGKVTQRSPFVGYAGNEQQTEKKRLRDVMKNGDLYFNTGDLLRFDEDNFVYFHDRVGDTFRWKGENVATSEVADVLTMARCILEANVYGVKVKGNEGRAGMAAITLKDGEDFDCVDAFRQAVNYLPAYARPRFIRIQPALEMTGTFKMKKTKLVDQGFNPALISDPLYYLDAARQTFAPVTEEVYSAITCGTIVL
ncbi:long-chain fatty acid transport protein 2-like isoform X2 [Phyllopteryx taeniolatus]|uniref:long-chain fatty acid transport protein 2-like isoform X2 n=1 Tax=Phyllopteryx taeniolatus TaxID=161469 RepID=UPI002AD3AEA2|nr:long-chain fatty acid transport protein 2-like isoform X2 [Phyllopteryx taeniolatus]